jgi:hypothetical protein
MKKIVIVFLLFSTVIFAQNQTSQKNKPSSFEPKKIVLELKRIVKLNFEQEEKLSKHLDNKINFFSNAELSDVRKEAVLSAYKEEFNRIFNEEQIFLLNKKNRDLYLYITTSY